MSVPVDPDVAVVSCAAAQAQKPTPTPEQLISSQSAGMGAIIQALGIGACTNATVGGGSLFPPWGVAGQVSVGCEQIALLSNEMNAAQEILQCSLYSLSQEKVTTGVQNCTIEVNFSGTHITGCNLFIEQVSNMYVTNYSTMSNQITQQISAQVETSMKGVIDSIQKQTETGLFPKSDGQKVVQEMTQNLDNMIRTDAITKIVQTQIEAYTNTGRITLNFNDSTILGNVNQSGPTVPCVTVTQGFVMQVLTQSIMNNTLTQVIAGTAKADLTTLLKNAQTQISVGFTPPDFGMLGIVAAIALVAIVLAFSKKNNSQGESQGVLSGKVGTIFGSILLVLGAILFIAGLVLKLRKKTNAILCYIMMAGGAILMIIAIVMIVKARSQQLRFEQNLQIAKAGAAKK